MIGFNCLEEVDTSKARGILTELNYDPMAGWYESPENYSREELAQIKAAAAEIREKAEYLVCVGIGGSYLGHKAVLEALSDKLSSEKIKILYMGNSLDPLQVRKVLRELGESDFAVNVISKSGTTTEPAIGFRILREKLIEKYGTEEAYKRIYATTDAEKGALHDEAVANNYTRFVVPDNIGGRYSVLTAVGLLPLAVAGVDVDELLAGAVAERESLKSGQESHPAVKYACWRQARAAKGANTEVLANFAPDMMYFNEWWKQLFGESEGKQGQGIFPASVIYSTDLHSMGQYMQEGRRDIFETMVRFENVEAPEVTVPACEANLDQLQYLEGQTLDYINDRALEATVRAHRQGGIAVGEISVPDMTEKSLGALIYFFEVACAVSAKMSGVNPFDQPGVEAYKTEMFKLLGKPGYEE